MTLKILSGDIGGTKTRLAIFEIADRQLTTLVERSFVSQSYESFDDVLDEFFSSQAILPEVACFGVAGPVQNDKVAVTNLPWTIQSDQIMQRYSMRQAYLMNDLEANAWGIEALSDDDFLTLQAGAGLTGNAAIISAGTGLGEAGLYHDGKSWSPFATEGGHTDFSPGNEIEIALFHYLKDIYSHVSWERLLSGHGLVHIHDFLREYHDVGIPDDLKERFKNDDKANVISFQAKSGSDAICQQSLELFSHLYGVEAGNLALKIMAKGGVFIGGGIAPKNLEWMNDGRFLEAFNNKGRMKPLLESMPVRIILNDRTALYGPAIFAAKQSGGW